MLIIPRLLFVLTLVIVPALVYATSGTLPERVATHFGRGGLANGWMSHDGYVAFILSFTTLLPLCVVAVIGFFPRAVLSSRLMRNRDRWFSAEQRDHTVAFLISHACWMGILLSFFLAAIHFLTVEANERVPARLAESPLFALLAVFVALLAIWIIALAVRFRRAR